MLASALVAAGAFRLFYLPVLIRGDSMEPNFHSGSLLLLKRCHHWAPSRRFEVVIARVDGELLLKRVIAFPGEWVSMTNGIVFVNGKALTEPFAIRRGTWTIKPGPISPAKLLLIGDNRELPVQSFFVVPIGAIVARQSR